jgi:hypothetical protein
MEGHKQIRKLLSLGKRATPRISNTYGSRWRRCPWDVNHRHLEGAYEKAGPQTQRGCDSSMARIRHDWRNQHSELNIFAELTKKAKEQRAGFWP